MATKNIKRNSKTYNNVLQNGAVYMAYRFDNEFRGEEVDLSWAQGNLLADAQRSKAKMHQKEDGSFIVFWHSRRWYKISM